MKSLLFTSALLLTLMTVNGQDMIVALQAEYTVSGKQAGGSIMYETKKQWGLGAFYQGSAQSLENALKQDIFYGAHLQCPLVRSNKLSLLGVIRGGVVNEHFFIVVPSIETRINIGQRFGVSLGMGIRKNYPSVSAKLICKLF